MKNYLAYGSNLLPARLRERVPSAMPVGVVKLTGWSLHFHKRSNIEGSGKCNIRNCGSENATVYGAIYGVAKNEIPRLDEAEGLGNGYKKVHLTLDGHGEVFLYLAADSHIDESLRPLEWYKSYVVQGAKAHGFPEEYINALSKIAVQAR